MHVRCTGCGAAVGSCPFESEGLHERLVARSAPNCPVPRNGRSWTSRRSSSGVARRAGAHADHGAGRVGDPRPLLSGPVDAGPRAVDDGHRDGTRTRDAPARRRGAAGYRRAWLRGDVLAGVTVAAYLVPQVMAYAEVAGLPPVAGLWACLGPLASTRVLGSSRQLSVGPESTTALMTATAVAPLAAGDPAGTPPWPPRWRWSSAALCLLGWLAAAGLPRRPAVAARARRLHGRHRGDHDRQPARQGHRRPRWTGDVAPAEVASFLAASARCTGRPLALALPPARLAAVWARGSGRPGPVPLIGMLAADRGRRRCSRLDDAASGRRRRPGGLPVPGLPASGRGRRAALLCPAVGVAIVAYTDNVLTARAFAARRGETDRRQPGAARARRRERRRRRCCSGFPVSSSGSRTAIGDAHGQPHPAALAGRARPRRRGAGRARRRCSPRFPPAALGAVVVYAALRLVDVAGFRRIARLPPQRAAICRGHDGRRAGRRRAVRRAGRGRLSVLDLLRRVARPHDGVLGLRARARRHARRRRLPRRPARPRPGRLPLRLAAVLRQRRGLPPPRAGRRCDAAAGAGRGGSCSTPRRTSRSTSPPLDAWRSCAPSCTGAGSCSRWPGSSRTCVTTSARPGCSTTIGEDRIFPTLPTAVAAFEARRPG